MLKELLKHNVETMQAGSKSFLSKITGSQLVQSAKGALTKFMTPTTAAGGGGGSRVRKIGAYLLAAGASIAAISFIYKGVRRWRRNRQQVREAESFASYQLEDNQLGAPEVEIPDSELSPLEVAEALNETARYCSRLAGIISYGDTTKFGSVPNDLINRLVISVAVAFGSTFEGMSLSAILAKASRLAFLVQSGVKFDLDLVQRTTIVKESELHDEFVLCDGLGEFEDAMELASKLSDYTN